MIVTYRNYSFVAVFSNPYSTVRM